MKALCISTAATLIIALAAGCSPSPSPKAGFSDVQTLVQSRTGRRVEWDQGTLDDQAVARAIDQVLAHPLTPDDAVQVALLNNRSLQARYENLGVAQADLVQAGLLSNPSFSFSAQFPTSHGKTRLDGAISQNLLGLLFVPLRKKMAAAELEQAKLHIAESVFQAARDTEAAWYTLAARESQLSLRHQALDAADAALALARRQHDAGTITDLQLAADQAQYQQLQLDLTRLDLAVRTDREALNRLMGLTTPPDRWTLAPGLTDVPPEQWDPVPLEDQAVAERLDLLAARAEVQTAQTALSLGKIGIITDISPGVSFERDTDGSFAIGPSVSAEIPLFDYGQARIPRLQALLRQAQRRLEALEAEARSDVRLAAAQLSTARQAALFCRDTLLPQQQRLYHFTQLQFNAMEVTVHDLLQARTGELAARENYLDALRDYHIARADLAKSVGGRLLAPGPSTQPSATQPAEPASAPAHEHQHYHHQ